MQNVPAQLVLTGECVKPGLEALDAIDGLDDFTARVRVKGDGSKAVITVPGLNIERLVAEVAAKIEINLSDIPEKDGGIWLNKAVPQCIPVKDQDIKIVEEGGFTYWAVRMILGIGFSNRFSMVEILLPTERRQEARTFIYRVQKFLNKMDGVMPDSRAQTFGNQNTAVAFAFGQSDPQNLEGMAKVAKTMLYKFVGEATVCLYSKRDSAAKTGRQMHFATSVSVEQSMATLADAFDLADFSFEEAIAEDTAVTETAAI